jgi:hypothetical protein
MRIRDRKKFGSGIQDKHPGSETLDVGKSTEFYFSKI